MLARSKAGHDKGKVYLVVRQDEDYLYLVDGNLRPLENPKKKKKKHAQPIYNLPGEIKQHDNLDTLSNADIKKLLKTYEHGLYEREN